MWAASRTRRDLPVGGFESLRAEFVRKRVVYGCCEAIVVRSRSLCRDRARLDPQSRERIGRGRTNSSEGRRRSGIWCQPLWSPRESAPGQRGLESKLRADVVTGPRRRSLLVEEHDRRVGALTPRRIGAIATHRSAHFLVRQLARATAGVAVVVVSNMGNRGCAHVGFDLMLTAAVAGQDLGRKHQQGREEDQRSSHGGSIARSAGAA